MSQDDVLDNTHAHPQAIYGGIGMIGKNVSKALATCPSVIPTP
jgi:hypothetical protein